LPAVFKPEDTPTPEPTNTPEPTPEVTPTVNVTLEPSSGLANPSFEDESWTDVDSDKQQPPGWELTWVKPGDFLYDSDDRATGSCECVHKFGKHVPGGGGELPPWEWLGQPKALVLSGTNTYKLFRADTAWGSQLRQIVALTPGSEWTISVPVQVHGDLRAQEGDFASESSVWVNDIGNWSNYDGMGDHQWCRHQHTFTVPSNGKVQIDIRFKTKYQMTFNYFIDDVQLVRAGSPDPHAQFPICISTAPLDTYRPYQE
jgi:hypothetical protein